MQHYAIYQRHDMNAHGDGLLRADAKSSVELVGRLLIACDVLQLPVSHLHFLQTIRGSVQWLKAPENWNRQLTTSPSTASYITIRVSQHIPVRTGGFC